MREPLQDVGSASKIQIAAYGLQDVYLRGTFSPFVKKYQRATRFAKWTDAVDIPWVPGQRTSVDIPKSGDILGEIFLRVVLPPAQGTWKKCIGYTLFRRVRLILDGQEIHNYERLWYDIRDALYESKPGYDAMVGRTPVPASSARELLIPLRFLTENLGFPLAAIPRASLKVDIEWELASKVSDAPIGTIETQLLIDYYDLENPERSKLTQGTALAFESAIDSDALSYTIDSGGQVQDTPVIKVNLGNARFAVKFVAWVAYDETGPLFTYLDRPLKDVALKFNNQDRISERPADYFTVVQKYQHFSRCFPEAPGVYSFSHEATAKLPSGVADFGSLAKVYLQASVVPGNPRFKLKVFSLYYNFLNITNGTGHLIYV
jgi:hypothetical protein